MDEPAPGRAIQHDRPARTEPETREETLARVADTPAPPADPSSRRGLRTVLGAAALRSVAAGAAAGALVGLVMAIAPGPIDVEGASGTIGYTVAFAAVGALVAAAIGALLVLAREDGRIEREVEEATGRAPEAPGSPVSPEHDPPMAPDRASGG